MRNDSDQEKILFLRNIRLFDISKTDFMHRRDTKKLMSVSPADAVYRYGIRRNIQRYPQQVGLTTKGYEETGEHIPDMRFNL